MTNIFFWKVLSPNKAIAFPVKISILCFANLLPMGYFAYDAFNVYNKANEFLF
jgi:hypothetical protein